jgi:hypothetical protein
MPHHLITPKFFPPRINVQHGTRPVIGLKAHGIRVAYKVNNARNTTDRLLVREPKRHALLTRLIVTAQRDRGNMQPSGQRHSEHGKVMVRV